MLSYAIVGVLMGVAGSWSSARDACSSSAVLMEGPPPEDSLTVPCAPQRTELRIEVNKDYDLSLQVSPPAAQLPHTPIECAQLL